MTDNNAMTGKDRADDRFRILYWLFKWGASPLIPVEESRLYDTFCVLLMACTYLTQAFIVVGILQNLHDVSYVIEAVRPLLSICSVIWMHFFIRYRVSLSANFNELYIRMLSSGMLRRVALVRTDVSEELSASIRVTRIVEHGKTRAGNNQPTPAAKLGFSLQHASVASYS
jgi:hypothetical protein